MEKQSNLSALKKAELIKEIERLKEELLASEVKEASTKKELILTREQLEASSIAIKDAKANSNKLLEKINNLEESNKKLSLINKANSEYTEEYAENKLKMLEKLRLYKFFFWLVIIMSIVTTAALGKYYALW